MKTVERPKIVRISETVKLRTAAKPGAVKVTSAPAAKTAIAPKTPTAEARLEAAFQKLGYTSESAKVAARGRGARPASGNLVEAGRRLGLSASQSKTFALGRGLREAAVTKHEDPAGSFKGGDFPASDYAYAPDAEDPETWALLLTLTPGGTADADSVQAAVGAIDPSTMGQNVVIPEEKMAGVVSKLAKAWKDSGLPVDEMPEVLSQEAARRAFRRLGITSEAGLRAAVLGRGGRI